MRFQEYAFGDASRWAPPAAAVAAAVGLAVLLAFVGRSVDRPPVIDGIDVQPAVVPAGGTALVRVRAQDPDGGPLHFDYRAAGGRLVADAARPAEARYTAADDGRVDDPVTVTVRDRRGQSASREALITIASAVAAATPTPPPTPEPAATPAATPTPAATEATPSTARRRTAPPAWTPSPAPPTPVPNRAPVLDQGFPIRGLGTGSVRLMATGHDPDDDPITHEWDGSGCFEILSQSATEAEVKFAEGCTGGSMRLTWTDPHGASASAEWPIRK